MKLLTGVGKIIMIVIMEEIDNYVYEFQMLSLSLWKLKLIVNGAKRVRNLAHTLLSLHGPGLFFAAAWSFQCTGSAPLHGS
jgi:hypothetical protein